MRAWARGAALAAILGGAAALAAWPAPGQDAPKSLLPPGFGGVPAPAPPPVAPVVPPPGGEPLTVAPAPLLPAPPAAEGAIAVEDSEAEPAPIELPEGARRPIEIAGLYDRDGGGFGFDAWGTADGRVVSTLIARLDAPIASRWVEILLRRALLARVPAPPSIVPADWVAARTALLLRLGEADGARLLVQSVDVDRFSPALFAAAADAALATADPAGLCPLAAGGPDALGSRLWPLASAMCAGLSGDVADAGAPVDQARAEMGGRNVDLLLAEKVLGVGTGARRSVEIDWIDVPALTPWRFGLATATGVPVPDRLYDSVGWGARAWAARAPMLPGAARLPLARTAAALGVFSNDALVSLYAALGEADDSVEDATSPAGRLHDAYAAADAGTRLSAIRSFWEEAQPGLDRYAADILTARAAARIAPDERFSRDAEALLAAMLSTGLDGPAARWAGVVNGMDGARGDAAWALLAAGAPAGTVAVSADRVRAFAETQGVARRHRAQLLLAGLAGLGRLDPSEAAQLSGELGAGIGAATSWTRLIDRAAAAGQDGTVALLAAVGLQTHSWDGAPPAHLFHIVAALRRTGHEAEACMVAAEAVTRT